jgi:PAS domain S-box-containing protein
MNSPSPPMEKTRYTSSWFGSIRAKLVVVFCLLFIVVTVATQLIGLWGIPFSSYNGRLGEEATRAFHKLNLIADIKKEQLLLWINERRRDAQGLASNLLVQNSVIGLLSSFGQLKAQGKRGAELWTLMRRETSYRELVDMLHTVKAAYGVNRNISIADASSGTIFVSTDKTILGGNVSGRYFFADVILSGNGHMSDVELVGGVGVPIFRVSHLITNHSGHAAAVLIMEVKPEKIFLPLLHTGTGQGTHGEALLVNEKLSPLTSLKHPLPDGSEAKPMKFQIKAKPAILAASGSEGIVDSKDYRGEEVLAAYRHIRVNQEWGWGLVVKLDKAELFAPLRLDVMYSSLLSLGAILAIILVTVILARRLTRPIRALSYTARKVRNGDLDARAAVQTTDEVGQLANTFNSMIRTMQDSQQDLEGQVRIRTEKLEGEINERKLAEASLRESEEKFRNAFENANTGMAMVSPDGYFLKANAVLCKMLGYSENELFDRKFDDVTHPEDLDIGREFVIRTLSEERAYAKFEKRYLHKNGETVWAAVSASLVRDSQENPLYFVSQILDITERKQAEQALKEREGTLRAIFEGAENISFIITDAQDPVPNVLEFSPGAEKIFGYTKQEMIGNPIDILHLPEDVANFPEVHAAMKKGKEGFKGEVQLVRKTGEVFPALFSSYPLFDAKGEMYAALGVSVDIREQKSIESRLQQTQKMEAIGTLAGGIAHDFNNILAAMLGYAELAMDDVPDGSPVSEDLKEVVKAGHRAKDLVRQILSFSRASEHEEAPLEMLLVLKEALKLLRPAIPTTIDIREEFQDIEDKVLADPIQMHQVIMNLCTNAAQAMEEDGGVLAISLATIQIDEEEASLYPDLEPGKYQRLTVSDTGVGMDRNTLDRVFEPFFTTKKVDEGTGMGLSVVHGIVKSHGGTVNAYSEPGKGSTFNVYLPVFEGEEESPRLETESFLPMGTERILLVDDEEAIAELGEKTLERLGYKVSVFTSSAEALEYFKSRPDDFDLVITDYTMPQMTGVTLSKKLLEIRPGLPIIITTGFSHQLTVEKAQSIGIKRMVMKPLLGTQMSRVIREVLQD